MEFIKTKENGTEINVIFSCGKYIFVSAWAGLVAIATRTSEPGSDSAVFRVEHSLYISERLIKRVINKSENKYTAVSVSYDFDLYAPNSCPVSLPYSLNVDIVRK